MSLRLTYEREHMVSVFLGLDYLTSCDIFQLHPFYCKFYNFDFCWCFSRVTVCTCTLAPLSAWWTARLTLCPSCCKMGGLWYKHDPCIKKRDTGVSWNSTKEQLASNADINQSLWVLLSFLWKQVGQPDQRGEGHHWDHSHRERDLFSTLTSSIIETRAYAYTF